MQGALRLALLCGLAFLFSGCAWLKSDITKVDVRFVASGDVNPDDNGRPSPVVVRLIELKSPAAFQNADFFALYQNEKQTLGSDWVAREEFEFKPGDVRDLRFALKPESTCVGILAGYRQMNRVNWRLILPLEVKEKNNLTVLLNSRGIEIASPR